MKDSINWKLGLLVVACVFSGSMWDIKKSHRRQQGNGERLQLAETTTVAPAKLPDSLLPEGKAIGFGDLDKLGVRHQLAIQLNIKDKPIKRTQRGSGWLA